MTSQQYEVSLDTCHRCGGLLVPEWTGETMGRRCVSCGERLDSVILAHRRQQRSHPRQAAEALFATAGAPDLN